MKRPGNVLYTQFLLSLALLGATVGTVKLAQTDAAWTIPLPVLLLLVATILIVMIVLLPRWSERARKERLRRDIDTIIDYLRDGGVFLAAYDLLNDQAEGDRISDYLRWEREYISHLNQFHDLEVWRKQIEDGVLPLSKTVTLTDEQTGTIRKAIADTHVLSRSRA